MCLRFEKSVFLFVNEAFKGMAVGILLPSLYSVQLVMMMTQEYNRPTTSTCELLIDHPDAPPMLSALVQATAAHTTHPFPCKAAFVGDCI